MSETSNQNQSRRQAREQLQRHFAQVSTLHMRDLFAADKDRAERFSIRFDDLFIDYSKHRINDETLALLFALARASELPAQIRALFSGDKINTSENRPALHPLLRAPASPGFELEGVDISAEVHRQLQHMRVFVERLHRGEIRGAGGRAINKVVSIGIGGSDLGPRLVVEALRNFKQGGVEIDFVSNLDPQDLHTVLSRCDAETTLFMVVSKTFTTLETRTNAEAALAWLRDNGCSKPASHLLAVTTNAAAAQDFGVNDEYIFRFWDWVGGRYSLWSSVGLSIAIAIGMDNFEDMLAGAHLLDRHFQQQAAEENIPVILALLSVWYNNYFKAETHAIIPYDQSLRLLPEYLSQLVMESNGKSVTRTGEALAENSSPVLWGTIGTNAQHAFFQMLHQGTHLVPVDFLLPLQSRIDQEQQLQQVSNCLAQSEALMLGQQNADNLNKHFPGNTPSTTLLYSEMTPRLLGILLAIYEHKTFVEAVLWDINPFDQWGVELGKKLAGSLIDELRRKDASDSEHDASTARLMREYRQRNS